MTYFEGDDSDSYKSFYSETDISVDRGKLHSRYDPIYLHEVKDWSFLSPAGSRPYTDLIFDEEYSYLHLFKAKYREQVGYSLGRSPTVDLIFSQPVFHAHRYEGVIVESTIDPSVVYLAPGKGDAWRQLKNYHNRPMASVLGPRESLTPPVPSVPGYCYLIGFSIFSRRETARRLGMYPTFVQLRAFGNVEHVEAPIFFVRSRGTAGPYHCEEAANGDNFWSFVKERAISEPFSTLGGAEESTEAQNDAEGEAATTRGLNETPFPLPESSNDVVPIPFRVTEIFSSTEEMDEASVVHSPKVSMDYINKVVESYSSGYCYLGLFDKRYQDEVARKLKRNPTVEAIISVDAVKRRPVRGVSTMTSAQGPSFHFSYELLGEDLWKEVYNLAAEDLNITIGDDDFVVLEVAVVQAVKFCFFLYDAWRFTVAYLHTLVCRWFLVAFVTSVFIYHCFSTYVHTVLSLLILGIVICSYLTITYFPRTPVRFMSVPFPALRVVDVDTIYRLVTCWVSREYSMCLFFLLGYTFDIVLSAGAYLRSTISLITYLGMSRDWVIDVVKFLTMLIEGQLRRRTYQSAATPGDKIVKVVFAFLASIIRLAALITADMGSRKRMEQLAKDFSAISSASDAPRALTNLWSKVSFFSSETPAQYKEATGGGLDIFEDLVSEEELLSTVNVDEPKPERVFQAGDEFPPNIHKHLITKGNIDRIYELINQAGRAKIHVVTAATGTGKSTAIPYYIANHTQKMVYIVIPTIAAAESSSQVIKARFGVTPTLQANSKKVVGDCNICVITAKAFMGKLLFNSTFLDRTYAVIFDEMHVGSAENFAFRKLSERLVSKIWVLWCSATFAQSFTLPGDLTFPVVERIHASVTLANIFTKACSVPGVSHTTIRGRYLVFCASTRDTQKVVSKFNKSGILAIAISSSNYNDTIPRVVTALKDSGRSTVIIAATPCLETGVTLPFNYVVDLREQIVPSLSTDPPTLTTKRISVTKGQATQRKGRVGRLFRGIYIAPPTNFTPVTTISESDLSLAHVYAQLFGLESPFKKTVEGFSDKKLTDSYLTNLFATRLDPIAVAGMSTPEGRIFKSFSEFEFPPSADRSKIVYSSTMFPESLWYTWPAHATSPWEQWLEDKSRMQRGTSVRAPFWDYTIDDKVQIDNWQMKVYCYRDAEITDAKYNEARYLTTPTFDRIRASWLYMKNRHFQMSPSAGSTDSHYSGMADDLGYRVTRFYRIVRAAILGQRAERKQKQPSYSGGSSNTAGQFKGDGVPSREDDASAGPSNHSGGPEPNVRFETSFCALPTYAAYSTVKQFATEAPWLLIMSYVCLLVLIYLSYCFIYAAYQWVAFKGGNTFDNAVETNASANRVEEKVVTPVTRGPSTDPHRPFESRRKYHKKYDEDFADSKYVIDAFQDVGRVPTVDYNAFINDTGAETKISIADRIIGMPKETDWDYEGAKAVQGAKESAVRANENWRHLESKVPSKTPKYSLGAVKNSVCSLGPASNFQHTGYGIIVRGYIFCNTHVVNACGPMVTMKGFRGVFSFSPIIAIQQSDFTILQLPVGIAGTAHNLAIRLPIPGEQVSLVRSYPQLGGTREVEPSEISYCALTEEGLFSYVINTIAGDCGTPVIAVSDGSLVGIHSLGGSCMDCANFMTPLTPPILADLYKRIPQRATNEIILCPNPYSSDLLHVSGRVAPEEQIKRPVLPLEIGFVDKQFGEACDGYEAIARMKKHVSHTSKIFFDEFALSVLREGRDSSFAQILDYGPAELSDFAYWKDVSKYQRSPQLMPSDFFDVATKHFETHSPWIFEMQELIPVDQVYYELEKVRSSGPRLSKKRTEYVSALAANNFQTLVSACESIYDVEPASFVPPVWQISLKDELRDKERVCLRKTRTFMAAPIETLLGNLRYSTAFNQRFIDHHLQFPSTMGIDKFRGGWNVLACKLGTENRLYSSGDGSRFDSSVSVAHLGFNQYVRCRSLPKKYWRHIRNWYTETAYTPLVMADNIIRIKKTGNPSGSVNTGVENSMALQATVYYALTDIFGLPESIRKIQSREVVFFVNGDDLVFSFDRNTYEQGLLERIRDSMARQGMNYDFTPLTERLEEVVFLSHGFLPKQLREKTFYYPVLDSQRIVATCLCGKKEDAPSKHSRYMAALIHSYLHPRLYPYVKTLVARFYVEAMANRDFVSAQYKRHFFLFNSDIIEELYSSDEVGFANKTYSHKNFEQVIRSRKRVYQMATLEKEFGESVTDLGGGGSDVLQEAGPSQDVAATTLNTTGGLTKKFEFTRGMDETLASVFTNAVTSSYGERTVVAKSNKNAVHQSVSNLRDFFAIDSDVEMSKILMELLIYYGDNSTSEQNPHVFPCIWKEREINYNDVDKCFVPTPRKFWRAMADITHAFLEQHKEVTFHWAEQHGFPKKYRSYGFDCADYCSYIPAEARMAVQAAKDAALTRAPYNLMRADLKAVGFGGGTIVEQITGSQFSARAPGRNTAGRS
uniref:RdRp n=3 Tax=unclassified Potyviridae TaxID=157019 RepID=A0A6B9Q453_9POTY|nr:RdRp [Plasmopara viticola lesion associated poty-like virus 1]QHD64831.1 RdRp [Erysiphe necator associated poty-like virus 1]QIJ25713.1 polyprotein [Plasmopara associated poty-like virus]